MGGFNVGGGGVGASMRMSSCIRVRGLRIELDECLDLKGLMEELAVSLKLRSALPPSGGALGKPKPVLRIRGIHFLVDGLSPSPSPSSSSSSSSSSSCSSPPSFYSASSSSSFFFTGWRSHSHHYVAQPLRRPRYPALISIRLRRGHSLR